MRIQRQLALSPSNSIETFVRPPSIVLSILPSVHPLTNITVKDVYNVNFFLFSISISLVSLTDSIFIIGTE